eukprot:CAMPEP_0172596044 /NCGR_PEP_ID=MMETSP1068-20121228/15744_1 /TAXON_ID=35684 /ORGANISM="Pseudopedinella elastica, Strain CCMP716" /LENGTH=178 /DNA_ID=CAMNT_0013394877 /DNA_START=101 /DNA_END=637 /DNA_ORIENTATION=-
MALPPVCRGGGLLLALALFAQVAASFVAPAAVARSRSWEASRSQLQLRAKEDGEDVRAEDLEKLRVFSTKRNGYKAPRDNRDTLPYYVDVVSPPPRRLGIFALASNSVSGDLVEHQQRPYEIQRVRCEYKYQSGKGFVLYRKNAEVIEATRLLEEDWLKRVMNINSPEDAGYPEIEMG